ncbi:hypothetical protein GCM10017607_15500 [Microbacterium thalassium]|nr:hypothetical protein GCM10017607_15500 [Microbacterium thalassium]
MPDTPSSASPAPGWYAESQAGPRLRWWNGSAWTDHYRLVDEAPSSNGGPHRSDEASEPVSRAARRAAEREASIEADGLGSAAAPAAPNPVTWRAVVDPPADEPAATQPVSAVDISPTIGMPAAPSREADDGALTAGFGAAGQVGPIPDNVVPPGGRKVDRIPPPVVVYQPRQASGPSTGDRLPISVVPSRRNGLVRASLLVTLIAVIGGAAAIWWLRVEDRALAGMVSALVVALLLLSTALAIGGIATAVRRSITWITPVLALIAALGALACAVTVAASLVIGFELPAVFSDVAEWVEGVIPR